MEETNILIPSTGGRDDDSNAGRDKAIFTAKDVEHKLLLKDMENNDYATKKSNTQNNLNISGIMQLISLLLAVLSVGIPFKNAQIALIVLVCVSISLQFLVFVLVTILANSKTEELSALKKCSCTATMVNDLVMSLSGLLLIINGAITALSVYARVDGVLPVGNSTSF